MADYKLRIKYGQQILLDKLDLTSPCVKTLLAKDKFFTNNTIIEIYEDIPPYTQLQYIQSSGTQYLRIPEPWTHTMKAEFKFALNSTTSAECYIFGLDIPPYPETGCISGQFRANCGLGASGFITFSQDTNPHIVTTSFNGGIIWDNIIKQNGSTGSATIDYGPSIFGATKSETTTSYLISGKLWYMKIYNNNILIHDLIPCKTLQNEVCMYDNITNEFYKNLGTGNFIAGPEV